MTTMHAAVFYGPSDLRLQEVEVPAIGEGEILLRVRAAGICGTDVRILKGAKRIIPPRIIGHEVAGEIVEVGPGVEGLHVGQRVAVEPIIPCGRCPLCLKGRRNICLTRPTLGDHYDGAFASYVRVPATAVAAGNVVPLPPNLSYEEGAFAEPLAACINGIDRCSIHLGDTVLILGAGPIGLVHLLLSRAAGAGRIFVSEPHTERRSIALELGADEVMDPLKEGVVDRVRRWTDGLGADVVIVAIGAPAAMESAIEAVRKGGVVNIFAGSAPDARFPCDPNRIHYGEIALTGSSGHTADHLRRALELMSQGSLDARRLITHRFDFHEIHRALAAREALEGLKHVVILPG
jgi:L-iditol 2-dehydrogenase